MLLKTKYTSGRTISDKNYQEGVRYLLYLNCNVEKPNVCFLSGENFYYVDVVTENGDRKIVEMSVAPEYQISVLDINGNQFEADAVEKYVNNRRTMNLSLVENLDQGSQSSSWSIVYRPQNVSSYALPSTIKIYNSSINEVSTVNFNVYCKMVTISEFGRPSDGPAYVADEATKAFALCVRNFSWFRALYPISSTGDYALKDNDGHQCCNWSVNPQEFPNVVTLVDSIWNYQMMNADKKLFLPLYSAGLYNSTKSSGASTFYQNGSNYLAIELGMTYKDILHYYYDDAVGIEFGNGPIIVCDNHTWDGGSCSTCGYHN